MWYLLSCHMCINNVYAQWCSTRRLLANCGGHCALIYVQKWHHGSGNGISFTTLMSKPVLATRWSIELFVNHSFTRINLEKTKLYTCVPFTTKLSINFFSSIHYSQVDIEAQCAPITSMEGAKVAEWYRWCHMSSTVSHINYIAIVSSTDFRLKIEKTSNLCIAGPVSEIHLTVLN